MSPRDPNVEALYYLEVTFDEHARIVAGIPLRRRVYPVMRIRGAFVGLSIVDGAGGLLAGEARLSAWRAGEGYGEVLWTFEEFREYAGRLRAPRIARGQCGPLPHVPVGSGPRVDVRPAPLW